MVVDYNDYICIYDYSDGYADYHRGDTIKVARVQIGGGSERPKPWVYPVEGHPIMLEAFIFCFIWKGDWEGDSHE